MPKWLNIQNIAIVVLILGAFVGINAWRSSQPASADYISSSVGKLTPEQRLKFGHWIDTTLGTPELRKFGGPTTKGEIDDAVDFATDANQDRKAKLQEQQEATISRLIPSPKQ
jgi:hypothetical protein